MAGKKWFFWLGKLHGRRKQVTALQSCYPQWAQDAYDRGWWSGFNSVAHTDQ